MSASARNGAKSLASRVARSTLTVGNAAWLSSAGNGNVEHREAIDGDAEGREIVGDEASRKKRRFRRHRAAEGGDRCRRGVAAPMGRRETGHPPALLVDQDRRIASADGIAERRHQCPHLVRTLAVAGKQDEPQGIGIAEEGALVGAQRQTRAAEDDRARLRV